jgi:prepilin-type N-terminal cleavage/methylation domain-containing protein
MQRHSDVRGFSLLEMLAVVSVLLIVGAMAVPAFTNTSAQMRVSAAMREVERELQTARMRAVQSGRAIRVRFNCPAAGQYRMVEVLGSVYAPAAADADSAATTRCDLNAYPYPDSDRGFFAIPNHDGPLRRLPTQVSFGATATIEFWPNGTAHVDTGTLPWSAIGAEGTSITIFDNSRGTETSAPDDLKSAVTVNGLGKITLQHHQ